LLGLEEAAMERDIKKHDLLNVCLSSYRHNNITDVFKLEVLAPFSLSAVLKYPCQVFSSPKYVRCPILCGLFSVQSLGFQALQLMLQLE
jgi:hypothetical protein